MVEAKRSVMNNTLQYAETLQDTLMVPWRQKEEGGVLTEGGCTSEGGGQTTSNVWEHSLRPLSYPLDGFIQPLPLHPHPPS